jgi:uncharacterized membrane protein YcaP (DUF421 family)
MDTIWTELQALLGVGADPEPGAGAMALRSVVVYAVTLVLVRLGSRRLLAKPSAFDVIVAIMLGSIMSRAINGSAPLVPTLVAGAVLLLMHWAFAMLAVRMHWLSVSLKGTRIALVHDDDPSKVQAAYMERSGAISVIPRRQPPGDR